MFDIVKEIAYLIINFEDKRYIGVMEYRRHELIMNKNSPIGLIIYRYEL